MKRSPNLVQFLLTTSSSTRVTYAVNVVLPYPSDVTVPLSIKTFVADGTPLGGTIGTPGGVALTHKYWNFTQTAKTWGYATGKTLTRYINLYLKLNYPSAVSYTPTQTNEAKNALPKMIFQIGGDMQPLAARSSTSGAAQSAWRQ
jgi:hypothetical protein